ncbi:MAG: FAD-binding protein [Peptococcaceae bacterium]|jgi:electron transfer flavoprotein alpha subunit|nr:FAD-binding protein [Peptococcaceae bacterium]MDH7524858.1 FAD-binding protein [Peptococcaceae bacterium]
MSILIDRKKCAGCGACIEACPFQAINLTDGVAEINENCRVCGACIKVCPVEAIMLVEKEKQQKTEMETYRGVWVFAEQRAGKISNIAFELLGEGRKLADALGVELSAFLIGHEVAGRAAELFSYGADNVYLTEDPELKDYRTESYAGVICAAIEKYKPEIVLIGATNIGRDLGPRVAARIGTGLTADCTGLSIDLERRLLLQTRPAFGGNLMATIICPDSRPQMATVRPGVMKKINKVSFQNGKVIRVDYPKSILNVRTRVREIIRETSKVVNLEEAQIIVSGGRGLGGPDGFSLLEKVAEKLGGVVGASRGAVDSGWIDSSHQVGQTGKTVHPKIYIACGISGAIQHVAGMQNSGIIVAINKNPLAPIFEIADYGIVGDIYQVLPIFLEALEAKRKTS